MVKMFNKFLFLVFSSIFFSGCECQVENLTAELANGRLFVGMQYTAVEYDGADCIYIFGGVASEKITPRYRNEILRYNISSDSVTQLNQLPAGSYAGSLTRDSNGNLIYFGGSANTFFYRDIIKFDPKTYSVTTIGQLEESMGFASVVRANATSNKVFFIGGMGASQTARNVRCFDLETLTECGQTSLLTGGFVTVSNWNYENTNLFDLASAFVHEGHAYIAGRHGSFRNVSESDYGNVPYYKAAAEDDVAGDFPFKASGVEKLNLVTLESETGVSSLPTFQNGPSAVSDGTYGYIIGGYLPTYAPTVGIIRVDPVTMDSEFLPVANFPITSGETFTTNAVFVEKLNRIYMIGGYGSRDSNYLTSIYYIQLRSQPTEGTTTGTTESPPVTTTSEPPILSCLDRPNGMYPHPLNCAMFVACHNGSTEVYTCPPPLLFNPVKETCDLPEEVECELSCIDKPNGLYPHPHFCSYFLTCHDGETEIYECPPPLLFDPELLKCNFPEDVDCQN